MASTLPAEVPWGETVSGLRPRLTLDKSDYDPMEEISSRIEIQNLRTGEITIGNRFSFFGNYSFVVTLPNGKSSPLTLWGQTVSSGFARANEIETVKSNGILPENGKLLNRAFDMTLDGKYGVSVHRRILDPSNQGKPVDLNSNIVEIVVGSK